MVKFLINRPIAVIMVFIAAVTLGIIAYHSLPVSLMPDIPIPEVTVNITYKNSSARELENNIVKPLRSQVMQVGHVRDLKSKTRDGHATISLGFDYGTDIDLAFIEVNEKIDAAMNSLPRDMERPRVIKASATDIPVFYLNLYAKDQSGEKNGNIGDAAFIELSEFAGKVIRKRIEQLPEVAMVDISGTVSPQLVIEPDMGKLANLNFTLADLENVLSKSNVNAGSLLVRDGHYQYNVRFSSVLRTKEDVENIYIKASERILKLKDIASVSLLPQKREGMFVSDGHPAITMAVIKQSSARLSDMRDKIDELVEMFEKDYPGIEFKATQNQTQLLDYSIANLKQNLLQGLLLVILVVFFFMRDLKLPLLIGLSLMVSVIISILFFALMHLSINIISLAGLILAVGNMMDNSIVVTENISQYQVNGNSVDDACIKGTNEVIIPQLSSLLVNVAVFLPLIFLSGIAGALMYDEAISVMIGLSVSYLVGITFMPVIYRLAYKKVYRFENKIQKVRENLFGFAGNKLNKIFNLGNQYTSILNFTFRHKRLNLFMYLMILPIGLLALYAIRKERMPDFTRTETIVKIEWNENINAEENSRRITTLLKEIEGSTTQSNSYIGQQQFMLNYDDEMSASETRIYLKMNTPDDVDLVERKIKNYCKAKYPVSKLAFDAPDNIFEKLFTSSDPPLLAEVTMKNNSSETDIPELLTLCRDLNNDENLSGINKIPLQKHINLTVDMEKLLLYDVSYDNLIRKLKTSFRENNIGTLHSFQSFIPLVISSKEMFVTDLISNESIRNNTGVMIPLNALVSASEGRDLKTITAGKDGEYVPMAFAPPKNSERRFVNEITSKIDKAALFDVRFSGSVFTNLKLLKEMGALLVISVLLLYFILAAQFESLVQPLLVLLELPIDIAAAITVLLIADQSLNIMSAMGIIIMSGIVITDSILKLDVINKLRKKGLPLMDAIREGGHRRLMAILMTSLTSILAILPLLFTNDFGSELQKPFSYALIGGMVVGTFVSLFLVPLIYWYIYKNTEEKIQKGI